jgi:hypothetical protein
VDVQAGTLTLSGGGTNSNTMIAESGATLSFLATFTHAPGSNITGTGTVDFESPQTFPPGALLDSGLTLTPLKTTLTFNRPQTLTNFTLSGGTLTGSGDVTLTGTSSWADGGMSGTGTTTVAAGATMSILHSIDALRLTRTLENSGTISRSGTAFPWQFANGTLNNLVGGTINDSSGNTISDGGGTNAINNAGTWNKVSTNAVSIGVQFINTGSVDVQAGTLTLSGGGTNSNTMAVNNGTLSFSVPPSNTGIMTTTGAGVLRIGPYSGAFTNAGNINISGGGAVIDYGSTIPFSTIKAQILTGFANGAWNGPGINSSAAAANAGLHRTAVAYAEASAIGIASTGSFLGGTVDNTSVLLRYTFTGDANLDGAVSTADFMKLAQNFGASGKLWSDGDFNYDGVVNALDFNAIATNFGQTMPGAVPSLPVSGLIQLGDVVPEPTGLAIALTLYGFFGGRRRCCHDSAARF